MTANRARDPTGAEQAELELRRAAGRLWGHLDLYLRVGKQTELPYAPALRRVILFYEKEHQGWVEAVSLGLALWAWQCVRGEITPLEALEGAKNLRRETDWSVTADDIARAAGRSKHRKKPGPMASPKLLTKRTYNELARGCVHAIQPDTNAGSRGALSKLIERVALNAT